MTVKESNPSSQEGVESAGTGNGDAKADASIEPTVEPEEEAENADGNASSSGDDGVGTAEERKLRHWKNSEFAVGCVSVTWKDDQPSWWCNSSNNRDGDDGNPVQTKSQFAFSSIVCGCLGAGRVGNMAVLAQSVENVEEEIADPETGRLTIRKKQRPKLLWVVGPYWTVNIFITFPLIFGVSGWICYKRILEAGLAVQISWSIGTFLMVFSLCMISCRNPGILYRHDEVPRDSEEEWRWNDQARTYRPASSRFDSECQVVVEGFDHTCPWTGTAIGSRNMFWFKTFVCMVPIMLIFTVILAAFGGLLRPFFG